MNGEKLRELRTKHHVSIRDLADYLGVSERTYQSYERNERDPSTKTLAKLVLYFGVSADYLIDADRKPEYSSDEDKTPNYKMKYLTLEEAAKLKPMCDNRHPDFAIYDKKDPHVMWIVEDRSGNLADALIKCTDALKRIQPEEGSLDKKENRLLAVFKKLSEKQQDSIITSAELLAETNK